MLANRYVALLLIVFSSLSFAKTEPLEFTPSQVQTTLEMLEKLGNKHYAKKALNDEVSRELLDNYLESLDPSKTYFLAEDIEKFNQWQFSLDDSLKQGDLTPGFEIYNLYLKRVIDRLNHSIALLENSAGFDFTIDETIDYNEENATWATTMEELDELWRKRIKDSYLRLMLAEKEENEIPALLIKRYKNALKRIEQSDAEDAHQLYMNALTSLYDPHTSYFSPRQLENFNISMSLKLEGIGAVLQSDDETTSVVRVIPGGPAAQQGILAPEDKIVGVGEGDKPIEDVVGWRLDDVVDLIRGAKGTLVRLEIIPAKGESAGVNKVISIVRDEVKLEEQAAKSRILELENDGKPYKVGVIDLPAFYIDFEAFNKRDPNYKSTTRDVAKLLKELKKENVDGIVLDLRNNGGGSLFEVTTMTDLFINPGPVVQIRKDDQISRGYRSRKPPLYDGPLVVLINRLSASASEIFAGAIQDYGRGLVVGTQSYGKGTVQALVPLHEGQVKLTESKFYRVSGDSTQHRGVVPDISFPSLYSLDEIGESSKDHALPWDKIHGIPITKHGNFADDLDELAKEHRARAQSDADYLYLVKELELNQARRDNLVVSLNLQRRKQELDEFQVALFELENARRSAKNQPPFASIEEWKQQDGSADAGDEDSESDDNASAQADVPLEDDPFLKEAGMILVDGIQLNGSQAMQVVEQQP
ncbi:MAG: carboxy terminal-processing peptidase [Porticoccaceae bacterium]|nr:carboxy terminal-processing peptidase [Porticoccaceae bacterium]